MKVKGCRWICVCLQRKRATVNLCVSVVQALFSSSQKPFKVAVLLEKKERIGAGNVGGCLGKVNEASVLKEKI